MAFKTYRVCFKTAFFEAKRTMVLLVGERKVQEEASEKLMIETRFTF